jgi:hypothetical protein
MMQPHKEEPNEEVQAFLPPTRSRDHDTIDNEPARRNVSRTWWLRQTVTWWLRLLLEFSMAVTIVYLVACKPLLVGRETIRRKPVPQCESPADGNLQPAVLTSLSPSATEDIHLSKQPSLCSR